MKARAKKSRIALFGMGTLGSGNMSVPVIIDLFERLSADFDVVFYSFIPIDASEAPTSIVIRQPFRWWLPGRVKYFLMSVTCLIDHLIDPYAVLFAVSVYPTGKWAVVLAKIVRRPVVVQLIATEGGSLSTPAFGNLTVPWLKTVTLSICKAADVIVAVADYQKKIATQNLKTKKEIVVLPLRINPSKFPYIKKKITFPVEFIQVAFYSRLKDQDTMFAAFAKVSRQIDCRLTVVGVGFDTPHVKNMMKELQIEDKVIFTGYIKNDELSPYFAKAHMLLHTALFETGCAVIQEAMASGVVVCGTRVGILDDIGDRYAGIIPPGNVDALAETMLDLVYDPQRYERLGRDAHQWITEYDASWSYKKYRIFFQQLMASR